DDTAYIPPQNIAAERAVLGGVLLDNKAMTELPAELKPESFYVPSHGQIFHAMLELWGREAPIDVVSVAAEAKTKGHNISVAALMEIHDEGMPQSIAYHASLVIAVFDQRQAINLFRDTLRDLLESPHRHEEIMARLFSANDK